MHISVPTLRYHSTNQCNTTIQFSSTNQFSPSRISMLFVSRGEVRIVAGGLSELSWSIELNWAVEFLLKCRIELDRRIKSIKIILNYTQNKYKNRMEFVYVIKYICCSSSSFVFSICSPKTKHSNVCWCCWWILYYKLTMWHILYIIIGLELELEPLRRPII